MNRLNLYLRTLPHLRASQLGWRMWYRIERRLGLHARIPPLDAPLRANAPALERLRGYARLYVEHVPPNPEEVQSLHQGRLTFLNQTEAFGEPLDWRMTHLPRLWRYHLHYFGWAFQFALHAPETEREEVRAWIHDWIAQNPPGTDVAWDSFVVSQRLLNWALLWAVLQLDDDFFIDSFHMQTAFLVRHLEYDVRANHLLKNAAALAVAGSVVSHAARDTGLRLLEAEVNEQILLDGGHYERSPSYHAHVLMDCLLVYAALEERPVFLLPAITRMTHFLRAICHNDGDVPLFGDSALDAAPPAQAMLSLATDIAHLPAEGKPPRSHALAQSGFYILGARGGSARMIVKAGEPGPAYQLGHAHCDALSYELSIGKQRVIVDSGVHGYAGSHLRDYCRSTRAHNTVCVNGAEQLEYWDTFRVARRYTWNAAVLRERDDTQQLEASYTAWQGHRHTRLVQYDRQSWLIRDSIMAHGEIDAESCIHFCPGFTLREAEHAWVAEAGNTRVAVLPYGHDAARKATGETNPPQGWYCPRFGQALEAQVLVLRARAHRVLHFGYAIIHLAPGEAPPSEPPLERMQAM